MSDHLTCRIPLISTGNEIKTQACLKSLCLKVLGHISAPEIFSLPGGAPGHCWGQVLRVTKFLCPLGLPVCCTALNPEPRSECTAYDPFLNQGKLSQLLHYSWFAACIAVILQV